MHSEQTNKVDVVIQGERERVRESKRCSEREEKRRGETAVRVETEKRTNK